MLVIFLNTTLVVCVIAALVALALLIAFFVKKRSINLVALVLMLLMVVAAWQILGVRLRLGKTIDCSENLLQLGTALELYGQAEVGGFPPSLEYLIPFYFDGLPNCQVLAQTKKSQSSLDAAAASVISNYGYQSNADNFTVYCQGSAHEGLGGSADGYPQYTSRQGLLFKPSADD